MDRDLLITNAAQLITLAGPARPRIGREMGELELTEGGAVLVRDGMIVAAGRPSDITKLAKSDTRVVEAANSVVMPGYVDAHTHPVFAGTRHDEYEMRAAGLTYQEIARQGGGILSTVRKTRAAAEQDLFEWALPRVRWFLSHGTTTIEAKSGYGLTLADELKILRVIQRLGKETPLDLVGTFLGAHEIPEEFRNSLETGETREDYVKLVTDEMLPAVASEGLAQFCDVFCESHVFTADESRSVLSRAESLGLGIRMHAEQLSLCGGARLASELGAVTADHLEYIDDDGIECLRASRVIAVLLPGAVFNLGLRRYAPARKLIESGVAVVLATDFNPGSSPTPSMQMIHSIACTQMGMTPAECITASTINAAFSLGLGEQIGSLETGKQADIVIFDSPDYRQIPYFFGVNHVLAVIKRGQVLPGIPGADLL